jgi:uncharacterized protein
MEKIERREYPVELRVRRDDGKPPKIAGHAAVFNSLSMDLGGFREQISPGAFAVTVTQDDIRALFNHDPNMVLGRNVAGTLVLMEDNTGLYYEINPPDTQVARDLIANIEAGNITQNSFGFRVLPEGDTWEEDANGQLVRTLKNVKLYDVSPVTYPAYPQTDIALRNAAEVLAEGRRVLEEKPPKEDHKGLPISLTKRMIEIKSKLYY